MLQGLEGFRVNPGSKVGFGLAERCLRLCFRALSCLEATWTGNPE